MKAPGRSCISSETNHTRNSVQNVIFVFSKYHVMSFLCHHTENFCPSHFVLEVCRTVVASRPIDKSAGHWGETSSTGLARFGDWREWDQDNSPQRQLAPRQLAPKKTRPKTTRPTFRRQLVPYSEDNSPHSEDNSPQLVLTCYYLKIKLNSFRRPATSAYRWVYIQT